MRKVSVFEDNFLRHIGLIAGSFIAGSFKHYPVVVQSPGSPNRLASSSFLMGMWRDSIIFKRTRLHNCIAFRVRAVLSSLKDNVEAAGTRYK